MAHASVLDGQRYHPVGRPRRIWVVEEVRQSQPGQPHARIKAADDPTTVRTLACAALADRTQFVPLDR